MVTSDSWCASLQPISERGLGSFLQALAEVTPDEDLQEVSDCWVHALEVEDWSLGESSERFICRVTINALEIIAELNSIRSPETSVQESTRGFPVTPNQEEASSQSAVEERSEGPIVVNAHVAECSS
jgi:hypothetical protein